MNKHDCINEKYFANCDRCQRMICDKCYSKEMMIIGDGSIEFCVDCYELCPKFVEMMDTVYKRKLMNKSKKK